MKYYVLIITLLLPYSLQDLPVHCLAGEIEGDWLIHMDENNYDNDVKCGHNKPDQNLDHFNINVEETFNTKYVTLIHLENFLNHNLVIYTEII